MLSVEGDHMRLIGPRPVRVFRFNEPPVELDHSHDFSEFLEQR
jgi:hypothetical protein